MQRIFIVNIFRLELSVCHTVETDKLHYLLPPHSVLTSNHNLISGVNHWDLFCCVNTKLCKDAAHSSLIRDS